jgi:hypothetical protein
MATTTVFGHGGLEVGGVATVEFEHGGGPVDSDIVVEWDFDNDGDFDAGIEDVTGDLVSLETQLGRDFPSQLTGKAGPGRLRMTLRNDDDRYNYFNTNSPLTQAPYSLKTGRKIRVRTAEAANPDPALLARDRFRRANNANIGATENGLSWSEHLPGFEIADNQLVHLADDSVLATVNVGVADYVVQAKLAETGQPTTGLSGDTCSIVYRFQDLDNYSHMRLSYTESAVTIELRDVVAGTGSTVDSAVITALDDLTLTVVVAGAAVTGFVDGIPVVSGTAIHTDETEVGLAATWSTGQPDPAFDDFYVWDALPAPQEGVLWTGDIEKITPRSVPGGDKTVDVTAVGRMAKLAGQQVPAPRYNRGQLAGTAVGHVLAQAGMLHPLGGADIINPGTAQTGPISFTETEGDALTFIRRFEDHELGFFHETPEGYLALDQRNARTGTTPDVTFSDAPGSQFGYGNIEPFDREREIVNQVTAGVAATRPSPDNSYGGQAAGTPRTVEFTIPSGTDAGDLFIVIVAWAGGSGSGEQWLTPLRWVNHRNVPGGSDQVRTRIYSYIARAGEVGTTYTLYADAASNGGSYCLYAVRWKAGSWYGTQEGIHVVEFVDGSTPPALTPSWKAPTLYLAVRAGMSSASGASVSGATYPVGYIGGLSAFQNGTVNTRDVGLQFAYHYSVAPIESPGAFGGTFGPFTVLESTLIAVRGFNGNPPAETVVQVQADDFDSQDDHNRIASHQNTSNLYDTEANALDYCDAVLAAYSTDRPIFELKFPALKNQAYRAQAIRRRVSDRITLVAQHDTGMLSAPADFFIENVNHRWSNAGAYWETTWQLSPA